MPRAYAARSMTRDVRGRSSPAKAPPARFGEIRRSPSPGDSKVSDPATVGWPSKDDSAERREQGAEGQHATTRSVSIWMPSVRRARR